MIFSPSLDRLADALQRAFPGLSRIEPLRLLGSGFGSLAVETAGGVVFRIARTAQAGLQYAREARLLAVIKDFPVAIPHPEWFLPASPDFPYGLIGYQKLPGRSLESHHFSPSERVMLAPQVGEIILALQRIPLETIPIQINLPELYAGWARLYGTVLPILRELLSPEEYRKTAIWWEAFLHDERMRTHPLVFQHGDLWYGNLLFEEMRVVGLVDFQEAGPGDPAQDFVPQLYLGERFLRQVMKAFQKAGGTHDTGFEHRLENLWALREFGGLAYAIEHDDRVELADALEKIRKGPILSRIGLDGWRTG